MSNEAFQHGNSKALSDGEQEWLRAIIKRAVGKDGITNPETGEQLEGVTDLAQAIGASKLSLLGAACGLGVSLSQNKLMRLFVKAFADADAKARETAASAQA